MTGCDSSGTGGRVYVGNNGLHSIGIGGGFHRNTQLQARDRACAQLIAEQRRAEARPVRWALRRLYIHYASTVLAGLVLTALVGMAWIKMA